MIISQLGAIISPLGFYFGLRVLYLVIKEEHAEYGVWVDDLVLNQMPPHHALQREGRYLIEVTLQHL